MAAGDEPIAHTADGRPVYDNAPTVVVMILYNTDRELLAIRRNTEPGKGKLALPGGFHMRGESWQQAGAREVLEEIGHEIDPDAITQFGPVVTDGFGHNLIFGIHPNSEWFHTRFNKEEVQSLHCIRLGDIGDGEEWAFGYHRRAAENFLELLHYGVKYTINN